MANTGVVTLASRPSAIIPGSFGAMRVLLFNLGPSSVDVGDDDALEWGRGLRIRPGEVIVVIADVGSLWGIAPPGTDATARPAVQYRVEAT